MHESLALKESAIEVVPFTEAGKASVISDEMLEGLLDRNWDEDEVVGDAKKATGSGTGTALGKGKAKGKEKATFSEFDFAAETGGGNHLAKLFGEDIQ